MCGRYIVSTEDELVEIREILERISTRLSEDDGAILGSEVCPSRQAPVITCGRELQSCVWGFEKWDGRGVVFNAKSETLAESRFFSPYTGDGRCIVPASSYFEWEKTGGKSIRYEISRNGGGPLLMAGIMRKRNARGEYAVITKAAAGNIGFIHPRMPLIFDEETARKWISGGFDSSLLSYGGVPVVYSRCG